MLRAIESRLSIASPTRLSLALAIALIVASVGKDLLLYAFGIDREIGILVELSTLKSGIDSWRPMYDAVEFLKGAPAAELYDTIFFEQRTKFQYPPTSLLPVVALDQLGMERWGFYTYMPIASALVLAVVTLASTALALDARRVVAGRNPSSTDTGLLVAAVVVGTLTFYPIMFAYRLGQIQIYIDCAVTIALIAWLRNQKLVAGLLMAVAALIKPQYAVVLLWALLRGERRFALSFVGTGAVVGLVSIGVFGFAAHFDYLSVLSYISRHGEYYWPNQSVNGLLNRLVVDADNTVWNGASFAPFHPFVYVATLLSSAAIVGFALLYRPSWMRRGRAAAEASSRTNLESTLDFSTAVLALTIASPVAWEHHYGVTWPILILAFAAISGLYSENGREVRRLAIGLGVSYLLLSNFFTSLSGLADTPLNVLQSYTFFGGLVLLVLVPCVRCALGPDAKAARTA